MCVCGCLSFYLKKSIRILNYTEQYTDVPKCGQYSDLNLRSVSILFSLQTRSMAHSIMHKLESFGTMFSKIPDYRIICSVESGNCLGTSNLSSPRIYSLVGLEGDILSWSDVMFLSSPWEVPILEGEEEGVGNLESFGAFKSDLTQNTPPRIRTAHGELINLE